MDMDAAAIAFIIVALAVGAVIGWLIGSKQSAGAKHTLDNLRLQLDEVVKERDANRAAVAELGALKAAQAERERGFEARLAELVAAKDALSAQFAEVGGKLLESAQQQFLARADQRFKEAEATSGSNLKALLQPVHERLQKYEETVTKVESERKDAFGFLPVTSKP